MALELVTGYWGQAHVTAEQEADLNAGISGSSCYVLPIGEKMRAEAVTSNKVRIFDGVFMGYGRQAHIEEGAYEDVTIENGTSGLLRNDMIIVKYVKDESTGIEGVTFEVLKGQTGSAAVDPTPNNQDIRTGVFESEMPMYRVRLNGLAIEAVEPLFYTPKTMEELSKKCVELETAVASLNGKFGDYTLNYPTDLFSLSQSLCSKTGNVVHVYVSLKTGATLTQGQTFKLTGHPAPVPWAQSMRIIDFNAASTYINVTDDGILISVDKAFSPDAWIRFAFSYICA